MAKLDYSRSRQRDRMRDYGTDPLSGLPGGLSPPRLRPSKADQRAANEAALASVSQAIECPSCGHRATVVLPPSWAGRRLKCSRCGALAGVATAKGREGNHDLS